MVGDACVRLLSILFPEEEQPGVECQLSHEGLVFLEQTAAALGRRLDLFRRKEYVGGQDLGFFRERLQPMVCESLWLNFSFRELTEQAFDQFALPLVSSSSGMLLVCLTAEEHEEYRWLAEFFAKKPQGFRFGNIPAHLAENSEEYVRLQCCVGQRAQFDQVLLLKIDEEDRVLVAGEKVNPINWIVKKHFLLKYDAEPDSWLIEELVRHQERTPTNCALF
jgi:hypothetical protein